MSSCVTFTFRHILDVNSFNLQKFALFFCHLNDFDYSFSCADGSALFWRLVSRSGKRKLNAAVTSLLKGEQTLPDGEDVTSEFRLLTRRVDVIASKVTFYRYPEFTLHRLSGRKLDTELTGWTCVGLILIWTRLWRGKMADCFFLLFFKAFYLQTEKVVGFPPQTCRDSENKDGSEDRRDHSDGEPLSLKCGAIKC